MATSAASNPGTARAARLAGAAHRLAAVLAGHLQAPVGVRLWDGTVAPLGPDPAPALRLRINGPGVLPSLLRRPSLDRLIRHYARGDLDLEGGTLLDLAHALGDRSLKQALRGLDRWALARALWPFLLAPATPPAATRGYAGESTGARRDRADNKSFISFHYDVGNDFYDLFLDSEMVYSCAYFENWDGDLASAQQAKLEMICRKLRLRPGERMLDIGCGWGGLACHAARHHGVHVHGITLSAAQLAYARAKIDRLGLGDRVTVELRDYQDMEGRFDKIASIAMYEAIGLANNAAYFRKMRSLLADDGLFLNHSIARGAKPPGKRFGRRAEHRAMQRYIFPGGELEDIGSTLAAMERAGFEVHDVEGWRWHYARTTRLWCERLTARRDEAEALVGGETYRIWVAYLAGVSIGFERGSLRLFQALAGKSAKGVPPVPPTRADLYREPPSGPALATAEPAA